MTGPFLQTFERVEIQGCWIRVLRKPLDLDLLQELLQVMLPALLPAEEWEPVPPGD